MTKHAALIVRVSSDHQVTARQVESVRKLAAAHYPDLPTEDYFEEEGISATKHTIFDRPQGKRLCEAITAGNVAVVVADEQSRLVRGESTAEWATFYDLCSEHAAKIHTAQEGVIDDDAAGELIASIRAWMNRGEIDKLRYRTRGGKVAAARAGRWPHGAIPYGYVKDEEKKLRPDPDAAPHVALAFQQVAEGIRKQTAHATFNKSRGKQMSRRTFAKMLTNRTYTGSVTFKSAGEVIENAHEPIVSTETFDRVQRILAGHAAGRRREAKSWPFHDVALCGTCGRTLRFHRVPSHDYLYEYVRCDHGEDTRCPWKRIAAAGFEANFVAYLAAIGAKLSELLVSDATYGVPTQGKTLEQAQSELADADDEAKRLGKLAARQLIEENDPDLLDAERNRDAARDTLARLRGEARSHRDELAGIAAQIETLATFAQDEEWTRLQTTYGCLSTDPFDLITQGWERADFETRREIVTSTLDRLIVHEDGSMEWHFRRGLIEALRLRAVVPLGSARCDLPEPEGFSSEGPATCTRPW